jgi:hypothetical protein
MSKFGGLIRPADTCSSMHLVPAIAETNDGSILFVFGDEAAAAAHKKSSATQPTAEPEEPAEQPSAPVESKGVEAAQPEAQYEKARGKKVKEVVKEANVKDGAETSGVSQSGHLSLELRPELRTV